MNLAFFKEKKATTQNIFGSLMFAVVKSILGISFTNLVMCLAEFVNEISNMLSTTTNIMEPNIFNVVFLKKKKKEKTKFTQLHHVNFEAKIFKRAFLSLVIFESK